MENRSRRRNITVKSKKRRKSARRGKREQSAGEIIGQGGYGCVFNPPLQCANSIENNHNIVSKLLLKKKGIREAETLQLVKNVVNKLSKNNKNIKNYFLINDLKSCIPGKLSANNLKYVNSCDTLTSNGFDNKNINDRLNDLLLIQLGFGGKDIKNIIHEKKNDFSQINNALIDLLRIAIIPINNANLYHLDIKDSNILYDGRYAKLIDWGLSSFIKKNGEIPDTLKYRPIQFNLPVSVILLSDKFQRASINFLKPFNEANVYIFIEKFYKIYYNEYNENLEYIFNSEKSSALTYKKIDKLAINYCYTIVKKFTDRKTGIFDREKYFHTVFLKNVDTYGFVISYLYFFKSKYFNSFYPKKEANIYKTRVSKIINKYCFSTIYADKTIDMNSLINDLSQIVIGKK